MIKILHLITDLDTGGAETVLSGLAGRMDRLMFKNIVVSMTDEGTLGHVIRESGIPVFSLGMKRGIPGIGGLIKLMHIIRKETPDVLQTWLYHADLLGLVAGRLSGVGSVLWNIRCSYMDMKRYPALSGAVFKLLSTLSGMPDAVVVNSKAGIEFHEKSGYRPKRWELIPNGFDTERFRPDAEARIRIRKELNLPENAVAVGLASRFDPMKGHDLFLEAAGWIASSHPEAYFVMAGKGVDSENGCLMEMASTPLLRNRVRLCGQREDMPGLMAGLDIFASASAGEGFPNVVGEAMASGLPCTVTDAGDSALIVGDTGITVPAGDSVAMAKAWAGLMEAGAEGRRSLGLKARNRIVEEFGIDRSVMKYEALYKGFGSRSKGGAG